MPIEIRVETLEIENPTNWAAQLGVRALALWWVGLSDEDLKVLAGRMVEDARSKIKDTDLKTMVEGVEPRSHDIQKPMGTLVYGALIDTPPFSGTDNARKLGRLIQLFCEAATAALESAPKEAAPKEGETT